MTSLKIWLGKKFLRLKSKLKLNINIERLNMLKKFSFFRIWSTVFWFNHTNIWKELIRVDAPMNYATLLLQTFIQIVRPKLFLCVKFFFQFWKENIIIIFLFFLLQADICSMNGSLAFLVALLHHKVAQIVENGGGILRNISSFIAISEDGETYR